MSQPQRLTQKQRILAMKDVPTTIVAGTLYKGRNPVYRTFTDPATNMRRTTKVAAGVPFVRA